MASKHQDHHDPKSNQEHNHEHSHGKAPVVAYSIGLLLAIVGLILPVQFESFKPFLFVGAMILSGYHAVFIEGVSDTMKQSKQSGTFRPNSHLLMGLAAIGACLLGEYWEGALLILIFAGAHFLEDYAQGRSQREISKLIEMNPNQARLVKDDGSVEVVPVEDLQVGDQVQVLNGGQVPIDGKILSGNTSIDESSINGESIPKEKTVGDEVFASTINGTGTIVLEVTKDNQDTVFANILKLVNQNKSNQTIIGSKIKRYEPTYVNLVLIGVLAFMVLMPVLFDWPWRQAFERALTILVSASPCALAAATISASLSATSNLAKHGILSKGSHFISLLADVDAIAFDKTGTLTYGKPEVTDYYLIDSVDESEILSVVVSMEAQSNHPLARAIMNYFTDYQTLDLEVDNKIGKGLVSHYQGHEYSIGKPSLYQGVDQQISSRADQWSSEGKTSVYVARDQEVIGVISMMDLPKENAKEAIRYFNEAGIHTTLISGDAQGAAEAVGNQLGLQEVIANVLPEDKSNYIKDQQDRFGLTAMVGDGVNDAPALVQADIGTAMGHGTDVAVEVSDLVLMQDDLGHLVYAHQTAQKMNRVIWQNVIFALLVVVFLITVSFLGLSDMVLSVIIHEGSTLVVIANGLRLLSN
ncbi:heavy metal translocating P-type ATPase [Hutsoniella sourekii]